MIIAIVTEGPLLPPPPPDPWWESLPAESTSPKPHQMGLLRGRSGITWPRPIPCQGGRLWENHTTQPPLPASLHASHALYTFTAANSFTTTYQQCWPVSKPPCPQCQQTPKSTQPRRQRPTTQTWSKPQHHCRPSPQRDRHRTTVQTSTYSPGTSSYQQVPMKTPQCTLCHPHCRPNRFHALVASHGHPNGTNLKQENGSLESSSLRFKLNRSRSSDWGGMKGLPLANRWPYTDGSVGLVTSGESAKLFQKHLNSFRMDGLIWVRFSYITSWTEQTSFNNFNQLS